MKHQIVIIVLLSAYLFIQFTRCEVILSESQLSAYQHLQCVYDLKTSNRICDCLNQDQVKLILFNYPNSLLYFLPVTFVAIEQR